MGCIGVAGRAAALVYGFASMKEVEVVRIADLDRKNLDGAVANLEKKTGSKPIADSDFRRLLDDQSIDVVAIGTPDHWHAIPTIMACLAGKDVYVQKPMAYRIEEAKTMAERVKETGRILQVGSQYASQPQYFRAREIVQGIDVAP